MNKMLHSKPNIIVTAMIFQSVPPPNQSGIMLKTIINVAKKLQTCREAQDNAKSIINNNKKQKPRVLALWSFTSRKRNQSTSTILRHQRIL